MRRLYLRIYLAVLASLAAFALVAGFLWHQLGDTSPAGHMLEMAGTLAQNMMPPAGAPKHEQQEALERLAANLAADVALFAADRTPLAVVGDPLPAPAPDLDRSGWLHTWGGPPAWALRLPDGRWLVARVPHKHPRAGLGLALTLALVALAVGVGAYPVARRLTARLERLQAGVESLGAGDLAARVKVEGHDEVARLAQSFNRAAGRIEELVSAHKSLLANASHELRTPLARIRMAVELIQENAHPKRKREIERDIAELNALIEEILLASRLDAVKAPEADEDVDLLALSSEECARYEDAELDGQPVIVRGDPRLLRRMIRNLLENARRHGAPPIRVRVHSAGDTAEVCVCDQGAGVPEAEREAVFRPFYRFAGGGEGAGTGLGLSLVRQIARRHGGDAQFSGEEGGNCVVVRLDGRHREGETTSRRNNAPDQNSVE